MPQRFRQSLSSLAAKYGCDKGLAGPSDSWNAMNFTDVYSAFFLEHRDSPIRLLEIGIGLTGPIVGDKIAHGKNEAGAASLRMWSEYFPEGKFVGADIEDGSHITIPRTEIHQLDQSSTEELAAFANEWSSQQFDYIIDDGSHIAEHQQLTLEAFFPLLRPGGIYFIEDLIAGPENATTESPVVRTLPLLLAYHRRGVIPQPNSFRSEAFLDEVSEITFHSPRIEVSPESFARGVGKHILRKTERLGMAAKYVPDSFQLAAIRKNPAAG